MALFLATALRASARTPAPFSPAARAAPLNSRTPTRAVSALLASSSSSSSSSSSVSPLVRPAVTPFVPARPISRYDETDVQPTLETISNTLLENKQYVLNAHRRPAGISDMLALGATKFLRLFADLFFKRKYGNRAIVLETIAAVPGMVASMFRHMRSLRRMEHDGGWVTELLDEAENERMHLLTFMKIYKPSLLERLLVLTVQGAFFCVYSVAYFVTPKACHRFVGYLEEEAVVSYTGFLHGIDNNEIPNVDAPKIAKKYWGLPEDAKLRDVVLVVRADEARHRDVNHRFSDAAATGTSPDLMHTIPMRPSQVSSSYITEIK